MARSFDVFTAIPQAAWEGVLFVFNDAPSRSSLLSQKQTLIHTLLHYGFVVGKLSDMCGDKRVLIG